MHVMDDHGCSSRLRNLTLLDWRHINFLLFDYIRLKNSAKCHIDLSIDLMDFFFLQGKMCAPEKSGTFLRFCAPESVRLGSGVQFVQIWVILEIHTEIVYCERKSNLTHGTGIVKVVYNLTQ